MRNRILPLQNLASRLLACTLSAVLVVPWCQTVAASDVYILSAFNYTAPDPDLLIQLNTEGGSNVDGWTVTLCHDPIAANLEEVSFAQALLSLPAPPDFHDVAFFNGGFTTNCIIDNSNVVSLPAGTEHDLYFVDYSWIQNGPFFSDIEFCSSSPTGPGSDSSINAGGSAHDPFTIGTFIFNGFIDPGVIYKIPRTFGTYDEQTGAGTVVVEPQIQPALLSLNDVTGFSMAVSHDPAIFQINSVVSWGEIADLYGGAGPELFISELFSDGWSIDVVFGPTGIETIDFPGSINPLQATYSTQPGAVVPGSCIGSWLRFNNSLGVANEVDYANFGSTSACLHDDLVIMAPTTASFTRGDCNADQARNIADAVFQLEVLFSGAGPAPCNDACDNNDDGSNNIADTIYLLSHLFSGGPAPPAPDQICGSDPTSDTLGCSVNTCP